VGKFTVDEKDGLKQELDGRIPEWEGISKYNQNWDIAFKVLILLISIGTAICSGLAATELIENTQPWNLAATHNSEGSLLNCALPPRIGRL
jgi:hypothetical protein